MKCIVEYIDLINGLCIDLQLSSISVPREIAFLKEYCDVNTILKIYYLLFILILLIF